REQGRPAPRLPHEVMSALVAHDWPGNVRELENELRRVVVMARGEVSLDLLSPAVRERRSAGTPAVSRAMTENPGDIKAAVADLERRSIEAALAQAGGNKSRAAAELGISRFALQRKLDKYDIGKRQSEDELEEEEETQPS
ncbi:MAG: hypothetical protein KDC14_02635, partial [Planctomycetes bacterium]|nr:hypothetical protein [Planctomycetota bacterium]